MKYFVTGATGFIGSRVASRLLDAGHTLTALVRDPAKAAWLAKRGAEIAVGDVTDIESLRSGMGGSDGVFHIAGWYLTGVKDTTPAARINIEGTRNVLQVMGELAIPKGVYTSTLAVNSNTRGRLVDESYRYDGPHLSEYDRTKWVAQREIAEPLMAAGLPLVIVLPGAVYGPGDHSAVGQSFAQYLRGKLALIPRESALCWAHVEDIAAAHLLAMDKGRSGESYIIAGPPHTLEEAFAIAEGITGVPAPRLRISPKAMRLLAGIMAVVGAVVPLPQLYHPENLRITAGVTYLGSNKKAQDKLGYRPRPLKEGLEPTLFAMAKELGLALRG